VKITDVVRGDDVLRTSTVREVTATATGADAP
jgi:hypothetical protein